MPWDHSVDTLLFLLSYWIFIMLTTSDHLGTDWTAPCWVTSKQRWFTINILWPHFVAVVQVSNIAFSCASSDSQNGSSFILHDFLEPPYVSNLCDVGGGGVQKAAYEKIRQLLAWFLTPVNSFLISNTSFKSSLTQQDVYFATCGHFIVKQMIKKSVL